MNSTRVTPFLRFALLADAAASGATGLLMAGATPTLAALTGLPPALLSWAGLALLPWALVVAWLGTRASLPRAAVWTVIAVNLLWVIDSLWVLFGAGLAPSGPGYAFVIGQAVAVAVFAELQFTALKRARPAAA